MLKENEYTQRENHALILEDITFQTNPASALFQYEKVITKAYA